jgi:hypothetical protein
MAMQARTKISMRSIRWCQLLVAMFVSTSVLGPLLVAPSAATTAESRPSLQTRVPMIIRASSTTAGASTQSEACSTISDCEGLEQIISGSNFTDFVIGTTNGGLSWRRVTTLNGFDDDVIRCMPHGACVISATNHIAPGPAVVNVPSFLFVGTVRGTNWSERRISLGPNTANVLDCRNAKRCDYLATSLVPKLANPSGYNFAMTNGDDGRSWHSSPLVVSNLSNPAVQYPSNGNFPLSCPSARVCLASFQIPSRSEDALIRTMNGGKSWSYVMKSPLPSFHSQKGSFISLACSDAVHCVGLVTYDSLLALGES